MIVVLKKLFSFVIILPILLLIPTDTYALGDLQCGKFTITHNIPPYYLVSDPNKSFQVTVSYPGSGGTLVGSVDNQNWGIEVHKAHFNPNPPELLVAPIPNVGPRTVTFNVSQSLNPDFFTPVNSGFTLRFFVKNVHGHCHVADYTILKDPPVECRDFFVFQERQVSSSTGSTLTMCYAGPASCIDKNTEAWAEVKVSQGGSAPVGKKFVLSVSGVGTRKAECTVESSGLCKPSQSLGLLKAGSRTVILYEPGSFSKVLCSTVPFLVGDCGSDPNACNSTPTNLLSSSSSTTAPPEAYKICEQIDNTQTHLQAAYESCVECVGGENGTEGIWTAIGCIKRDPTEIIQNLLRVGLGMGGGVALLMILAAGFLFSISQGDPKRTGEAKELITAAVTGLLFIIFSVVILQFIGYTVLQIPGFGG